MAKVAPYAGAWIETLPLTQYPNPGPSLPTRERGLKPEANKTAKELFPSLPTRERGLKLSFNLDILPQNGVAPYAGAWIETSSVADACQQGDGRSLRGSVD